MVKLKKAKVAPKKKGEKVVATPEKAEAAVKKQPSNLGSIKGVQVMAIKDSVVNRIAYKEVKLASGVSCLMSAEELEAALDDKESEGK